MIVILCSFFLFQFSECFYASVSISRTQAPVWGSSSASAPKSLHSFRKSKTLRHLSKIMPAPGLTYEVNIFASWVDIGERTVWEGVEFELHLIGLEKRGPEGRKREDSREQEVVGRGDSIHRGIKGATGKVCIKTTGNSFFRDLCDTRR